VEWCQHCQADLRRVEPRVGVRHQLTELPPVTPVVLETRQHEVVCPDCQRVTRGELPEGAGSRAQFRAASGGDRGLPQARAASEL